MFQESLHQAYVRLTGLPIAWNFARLYTWDIWLAFRKPPFTEGELAMVVRHLKAGIKDGERNPGCLKFTNLIGNPERFEEDLADALARGRIKPPDRTDRTSVLAATGRKPAEQIPPARQANEILGQKAFQEFLKLKENL